MTQVTLLKDGVSVDDRVYSAGEVVTVPDNRAAEMVKAGEADYAVEHGAERRFGTNTTHPVTDQGAPIDPETGEAHTELLTHSTGQTLDTNQATGTNARRQNAATPKGQPAANDSK